MTDGLNAPMEEVNIIDPDPWRPYQGQPSAPAKDWIAHWHSWSFDSLRRRFPRSGPKYGFTPALPTTMSIGPAIRGSCPQALAMILCTPMLAATPWAVSPSRVDLGCSRIQIVLLARRNHHCRAVLGKAFGHRQTHALGGAGQQRHLSRQIKHAHPAPAAPERCVSALRVLTGVAVFVCLHFMARDNVVVHLIRAIRVAQRALLGVHARQRRPLADPVAPWTCMAWSMMSQTCSGTFALIMRPRCGPLCCPVRPSLWPLSTPASAWLQSRSWRADGFHVLAQIDDLFAKRHTVQTAINHQIQAPFPPAR